MANPDEFLDSLAIDLFRDNLQSPGYHGDGLVGILGDEEVREFESAITRVRFMAQRLGMFTTAQFHEYRQYESGECLDLAFTKISHGEGNDIFRITTNQYSRDDLDTVHVSDATVKFGSSQPKSEDYTLAGLGVKEGTFVIKDRTAALPESMPPLVCVMQSGGRRLKQGKFYEAPLPLIPMFQDSYDRLADYHVKARRLSEHLSLLGMITTHVIGYPHDTPNLILPS